MKKQKNTISSAKYFYDEVSDFYEKMVDFGKNLDLRINAYKNLFPVKGNIADLGCGIWLDSIALALNGHVVTSFDVSPKMIEETKRNAEKYKVNLTTELYSLESIPKSFKEKFNNVVSVGNTIAHFDIPTLKKAIKKMY